MSSSPSSVVGAWDSQYQHLTERQPYGSAATYEVARAFLHDCETVEDWGCGMGWFKMLRPDARGIDGSCTPFADEIADLTTYTSAVDGILLRHVLDHNYAWEAILGNAIASARRKIVVVLFLPTVPETRTTRVDGYLYPGVPDIAFRLSDVTDYFGLLWDVRTARFGEETVITAELDQP